MFSTVEKCRLAWDAAGMHGSKEERIARNLQWLQYYQSIAAGREINEATIDPHAGEIANCLVNAGILHDRSTLLDIGSGTGVYSLAFAKHCSDVTALDMDAVSLDVLARCAAALKLPKITGVRGMWENFTPDRAFSLTFSSMCPAICNYEELLKMEAMTTEACCLIAVTRGSYDLHRKNLMRFMNVRPKGGMTTEAIWYYEMLYLMGRQPDVRNWTRHVEYDIPVEEACRRSEVYFEIFGIPVPESRPVLKQYFESSAEDGLVHDISHLNTALIYWKVPEK